jgi:tRNAThr (cytosine32-N3)-methyltransferase
MGVLTVWQANPLYTCTPAGKGTVKASVWDLSSPDGLPEGVEAGSVDIVVMIFVLSALHPCEWTQAVANIYTVSSYIIACFFLRFNVLQMLKPGGLLLMRDYGRHDLAQLRFKEDRLLEDHLYVRGDGTRVYFFTIG